MAFVNSSLGDMRRRCERLFQAKGGLIEEGAGASESDDFPVMLFWRSHLQVARGTCFWLRNRSSPQYFWEHIFRCSQLEDARSTCIWGTQQFFSTVLLRVFQKMWIAVDLP